MQTTQRDYLALQPSLQPDVQPDVVQPDLQPNLQLGLQPGNHCAPGGGSTLPPLLVAGCRLRLRVAAAEQ